MFVGCKLVEFVDLLTDFLKIEISRFVLIL